MLYKPKYLPEPKYSVRADFCDITIRLITRKCRPVLIGEVSLETGYALATCEWNLENLVEAGRLIKIDNDEWRKLKGFNKLVVAYTIEEFTL